MSSILASVKRRLPMLNSAVYDGFRLTVEAIEPRWLPSASLFYGDLVIQGTPYRDSVVVEEIRLNNQAVLKLTEQVGILPAFPPQYFKAFEVRGHIEFYGGDGDDSFHYSNSTKERDLSVFAHGGNGNDDLHGGRGADYLYGDVGNDVLTGGPGNDWLEGDGGNDRLWGAAGNDWLFGFGEHGDLHGPDGKDVLYGGSDNDHLNGGIDGKQDMLVGGTGKDVFTKDIVSVPYLDHGKPATKEVNIDLPRDFHPQEGDWYGI